MKTIRGVSKTCCHQRVNAHGYEMDFQVILDDKLLPLAQLASEKNVTPSLGCLILLTTVLFTGTSESQGWPRSTRAGLCDRLPLSPGRVLVPFSPGFWCRETNFIGEKSPEGSVFLQPLS